ncbi:hypothetical protein BN8_p06757 (plasmid) [Fibrisoma limi BUZ 3]|uniref:Uncharacterized protein n=1 Tax=Fibrisoma limi BUZ 3 TaxID=1185876 RepID=I2GTX0_9BACT|nr:hypothetical protein [Fibrisoma limi]CCH57571.1 hypothetical protein BN8_p06757 [Fibrisoma limi BUZ 3]
MNYLTTELTEKEVGAIGKLLLNAWSAEYALRLTLTMRDIDFLKSSVEWIFPQAYYAAFFSARAVLVCDGLQIANQKGVNLKMNQRAATGFYGPSVSGVHSFSALTVYQLGNNIKPKSVTGIQAIKLQRKLVTDVHAIAQIHETYIYNRLGVEASKRIINALPDYLKNGFVGDRATLLRQDN